MLGDGKGDAGNVRFLKCVGTDQLASDLPGDADDRRGIHHRSSDARDHIGSARPGGRDCHSNLAAGAGIAIRHVRGALFVTHQNVMNVAMLQSIVRW